MKAITLTGLGGIENLKLAEVPLPVVKSDQVLIKAHALSINPVDTLVRSDENYFKGIYGDAVNGDPVILGWDVAGTVVETGAAVTKFKIGDPVFGMVNFPGQGKAYAEFVASPEAQIALIPERIGFAAAAASTLAALTAWQCLVTFAKVKKNDRVLIHSAAGGVGHLAVQIAKSLGAYVIGTGSADSLSFITGLGADLALDYTARPFEEVASDMDVVIDGVSRGSAHLKRSIKSLKHGGRLLSLLPGIDDEVKQLLIEKDIFGHRFVVSSNGADMEKIADLLAGGKLKPFLTEVRSLGKLADAHAMIETGKTRGKLVVTLS